MKMFWSFFLFLTGLKLLLMTSYRSSDFEVHRNWMAITHSLPIDRWYMDTTNKWTLDYPPFFAYFEWSLSQVAFYFDPKMLLVENLNYDSVNAVYFQRLSVMVADLVFAIGAKKILGSSNLKQTSGGVVLLGNVGLIFVDHIHFQYNGFLFGMFMLSIYYALERKYIRSALVFASLLNFKHIFLYVVPAFGAYFIKYACFKKSDFIYFYFLKLVGTGALVFMTSFAPFYKQIPQVLSRLFPFKRGLTHSYWAPNFWAMYNSFDKLAEFVFHIPRKNGSSTDGIAQEFHHAFLPTISPVVTFCLTSLCMVPCLVKLIFFTNKKSSRTDFLRVVVICAYSSYMFGWHVHEKAILIPLIPLCLLALDNVNDAKSAFLLSVVGNYSLFPLLFSKELFFIKHFLLLTYLLVIFSLFKAIHKDLIFGLHELSYMGGLVFLPVYAHIISPYFNLDMKLPFLPLLLTSFYCSIGVLYVFINIYYMYLISLRATYKSNNEIKISKTKFQAK